MNFSILLLGSDMNAYYMARCHHELYGKKVDMMSKMQFGVTKYSNIINFIEEKNLESSDGFVKAINTYAEKSRSEKIIVIGTSDKYVRLIVENGPRLNKKCLWNYPSLDIVNTLLVKDLFYTKFGDKLSIPKTKIYSCSAKNLPDLSSFAYPLIVKPGNGVEYNKHSFTGMNKVYKITSHDHLLMTIKNIEGSGYRDNLIIQEFIPGGDDALRDAVFYVGTNKKAQLATFAQIGLQERTPTGVGNCTLLVNGFDEHGYPENLIPMMQNFLESIGYQGFAEFDLKYDSRDGSYKILEINPRQARSSYYLAYCGHNLIEYLVEDLIYHKTKPMTLIREKMVLSFVPKSILKKYIESPALKKETLALIKAGKFVRPLHYAKDWSIQRAWYLFLRDINYILKYRSLKW